MGPQPPRESHHHPRGSSNDSNQPGHHDADPGANLHFFGDGVGNGNSSGGSSDWGESSEVDDDSAQHHHHHIELPDDEGWELGGYEVHMTGVGVVNVFDVDAAANRESDENGEENGEVEEDNVAAARRAGYRLLPNTPNNPHSQQHFSPPGGNHSPPSPPPTLPTMETSGEHVAPAPTTTANLPSPSSIELNDEKIREIKQVMSRIQLPLPHAKNSSNSSSNESSGPLFARVDDAKLFELVHQLREKNSKRDNKEKEAQ